MEFFFTEIAMYEANEINIIIAIVEITPSTTLPDLILLGNNLNIQ